MSAGGPGAPEPPLPAELQPGARPSSPPPRDDGSLLADWQSILGNRLILAGLAVLIVLLLTTLVLVFMGSGDDAADPTNVEIHTPAQTSTPLPPGTVIGRMRTTASVLAGPDFQYVPLGTARSGLVLTVVGRNEDGSWLRVVYPPGTQLEGWVDRTLLDVTGNTALLRVSGPEAGPNVEIPTNSNFPTSAVPTEVEAPTFEGSVPTSTPRPTRTRAPTATPISVRTLIAAATQTANPTNASP